MMWVGAPKGVVGRLRSGLKLRYQENRVDPLVIWYFEPIDEASYSFFDLERADVLLG